MCLTIPWSDPQPRWSASQSSSARPAWCGFVDALDVRILRAMGLRPYGQTPRPLESMRAPAIARALGASPERVRGRIERMEKSGLIEGYDLYPNYRHLGLEATWFYYQFPDEDAAEAAAGRLAPIEGVSSCCWFMTGLLCAHVLYKSPADLDRKLRLLMALAGKGALHKFYDVEMPPVHRPLSKTDWLILRALRGQALRPLPDVAREATTSTKTVRRHIDRMGKEGSFFPFPVLDPSRAEGTILFYLAVSFGPEAGPDAPQAVPRALEGAVLSTDRIASPEIGSLIMLVVARSSAQVSELRRKVAAMPGIARAKAMMFSGVNEDEAWIDEGIAERIRGAPK